MRKELNRTPANTFKQQIESGRMRERKVTEEGERQERVMPGKPREERSSKKRR